MTYRTLEAAIEALDSTLAEVILDQPGVCVDSAWFELGKYTIAEECTPSVKKELMRYLGTT